MEHLLEMYNALDSTMKFYWTLAGVTSFIFLVQMVLTFIGIGDTDADFDFQSDVDATAGDTLDTGGVLALFSVRNVINFLLGLGWGGVCFASVIESRALLHVAAFLTGVVFVLVFIFLFKQLMKLESNGAPRMEDCVGKLCDVYLRIPAEGKGQGKVQVSFGGSVHELAAITEGDMLPSGEKVRILRMLDDHTVVVEKA